MGRTRDEIVAARAAARRAHGEALWDAVAAVLYAEDPAGLAAVGAPADEYEPEVETLLPRLSACRSAGDVQRALFEEFVRWFGVAIAGAPERYAGAAERIWALRRTLELVVEGCFALPGRGVVLRPALPVDALPSGTRLAVRWTGPDGVEVRAAGRFLVEHLNLGAHGSRWDGVIVLDEGTVPAGARVVASPDPV